MSYTDDPIQIVFANRTLQPTLGNLQEEVTRLALMLDETRKHLNPVEGLAPIVNELARHPSVHNDIRPFDTDYTLSATAPADVIYGFRLTVQLTLLGTDTTYVTMYVNGNPVMRVGKSLSLLSAILGLVVGQNQEDVYVIAGHIPANASVRLGISGTSGTAPVMEYSMETY